MNNGDMPASPLSGDAYQDFASYDGTKNTSYNPECQGMTKRELMAMYAMKGILANSASDEIGYTSWAKSVAKNSLEAADALLKELDKPVREGE